MDISPGKSEKQEAAGVVSSAQTDRLTSLSSLVACENKYTVSSHGSPRLTIFSPKWQRVRVSTKSGSDVVILLNVNLRVMRECFIGSIIHSKIFCDHSSSFPDMQTAVSCFSDNSKLISTMTIATVAPSVKLVPSWLSISSCWPYVPALTGSPLKLSIVSKYTCYVRVFTHGNYTKVSCHFWKKGLTNITLNWGEMPLPKLQRQWIRLTFTFPHH